MADENNDSEVNSLLPFGAYSNLEFENVLFRNNKVTYAVVNELKKNILSNRVEKLHMPTKNDLIITFPIKDTLLSQSRSSIIRIFSLESIFTLPILIFAANICIIHLFSK